MPSERDRCGDPTPVVSCSLCATVITFHPADVVSARPAHSTRRRSSAVGLSCPPGVASIALPGSPNCRISQLPRATREQFWQLHSNYSDSARWRHSPPDRPPGICASETALEEESRQERDPDDHNSRAAAPESTPCRFPFSASLPVAFQLSGPRGDATRDVAAVGLAQLAGKHRHRNALITAGLRRARPRGDHRLHC